MRIKSKILTIITILLSGSFICPHTSALEYSTTSDVSFTFNSTVNVSLSSSDLIISELAPSTSADSNIITITVSTNSRGGYTLSGSVGNGDSTTSYDTTNLVQTNNPSSATIDTFTSLTTDDGLSALSTPGTWGYSAATYDTDNSTWNAWSNYSGLPQYGVASKVLANKLGPITDIINFKIAALAKPAQAAGDYKNYINFTAVAEPEPEPEKDISTATYMQEVKTCPSTLETGKTYTLTDNRDGEKYIVAKLADNNCWMLDNLRLDPTAVDLAILQGNTNASNTTLGYLKNGGGASPYTTTGVVAKTASGGSWSNSYNLPYIATSGTDNGGWDKNTETSVKYGAGSGKIGVYYNYCAASAGSYCYESKAGDGNVSEDLCPAGWRMSTGDSSGEYQTLYAAYSGNAADFKTALSTPLSGDFYNGSQSQLGSSGYFWSSTYLVHDKDLMYYMSVSSNYVDPAEYHGWRNMGFSVRCVVK